MSDVVIPAGTIKRLHVDKHIIASNNKYGRDDPPLTVQTSKGPIKATCVRINGPSEFIYRPHKPLSCGARAWIETTSEVEILKVLTNEDQLRTG